ncbi:TonB-dependent receptor [Steroidobacter sp.]|uniref:TonB-dependent receptor n=1 Tax=Steroidobacter sp. TaxID=1978227 RepID=UPI001A3E6356|nr:TonB-dependent receptor [Steroidobacter sp.]MBL8268010.1 TonB-dependent receptor [Steroidobacter sp.]
MQVSNRVRSHVIAVLLTASLASASVTPAFATEEHRFDVPATEARAAIRKFAAQAKVQILADGENVQQAKLNPVSGQLSTEEGLKILLARSGLQAKYVGERSIALVKAAEPTTSNGESNAAGSDASDTESSNPALRGIPEILVTGARSANMDIVRTEDDAQAYYIFDSGVIEQSGAVNVEDFLKRGLSMNTAALSSSQVAANFRGSQSSINLRGLGDNQTLVLINGRRTASPGLFGRTYQPNLNSIPPSAIERIEVLPSSSAAIYGGSAVGGVVNVVLKRGFTGGDARVSYANVMDGDAPTRSVGGTYGLSLEEGRTHISMSALYSETETLTNADRPELLQRGVNTILRNNPELLYSRTNPFFGATTNIGAVAANTNLTLRDGTPLGSAITSVPVGFTAASDPALLLASAGRYNTDLPRTAHPTTGRRRAVGSAPELGTVMASLQREMTDSLNVFADVFWSSNTAKTGDYSEYDSVLQVSAASPVNPFQQDVFVSMPDPFGTDYQAKSMDRRATVGFTFKLPRSWMLSSDYTWSESRMKYGGSIYSFGGISDDIESGVLNPFVDTIANPIDLSRYRGTFGSSQNGVLSDVNLRVAGPLFDLPAGPATLTVGLGYRKESLSDGSFHNQKPNYPDDTQYRKYFSQSQTIKSAYAEANIPLIGRANDVPGVRLLDAQLSVRTEDYSIGSGTAFQYVAGSAPAFIAQNPERVHFNTELQSTNPTIGLRWQPVDSLTLRASYGKAFLPPTYSQLVPGNVSLVLSAGVPRTTQVIDPRRGNELTTVEFSSGGNPDLQPQKSDNLNVGLIFEPTFLPALRLNVEWYRLKQENIIVNSTNDTLILANEARFADRIVRAPVAPGDPYGVGVLTFVDFSLFNANRGETEGIDLSMSYRWQTDRFGTFNVGLAGTKVLSYKIQAAFDAPLTDIVNQVAFDGPLQTRANASLGWSMRQWNLGWLTNYYGSYPQYSIGGATHYTAAQGANSIPSQLYHDVFASYEFETASGGGMAAGLLSDVAVQVGIKNLFDKTPPFDAYYLRSNYYSPFGDWRLRNYYLTLTKKF